MNVSVILLHLFFCNSNGIQLPFLASLLHVNSTCIRLIPKPAIIYFIPYKNKGIFDFAQSALRYS